MSALPPGVMASIDASSNPPHWLWTGPTNYGSDTRAPKYHGKYVRAMLWDAHRKDARPDRIGTSCAIPRCVNPEHLVPLAGSRRADAAEKRTALDALESIDARLRNIEIALGLDPFTQKEQR